MKKIIIWKKLCLSLLMICGIQVVYAQQDPQYTQYMYNTNLVNPAYAGSRDMMSVFGVYRTQWIGLEGAPQTTTIALDTPLGDSRMGLGVSFMNDRLGAMDENTIAFDLSYTIDLNPSFKLGFGLKASANLLNVDYTKLDRYNANDEKFQQNIRNQFSPNIGAGIYVYSDKTYFGISVPKFLETDRYDDNEIVLMKQKMSYYLIGGHVFDLSPGLKFKPAFLVKSVSGAPLQVDLTANLMISEKFVVGGAYRWDAAFSGLVGFQLTDGLFVGYSYDAETTKLANYNSGSHEVFLRFDFFNKYGKISSPRFF